MDIPYIRSLPMLQQGGSTENNKEEEPQLEGRVTYAVLDELQTLKELLFHSTVTRKIEWADVLSDKMHDSKFWSQVTHTLGPCILKNVFNADMPVEDSLELEAISGSETSSGVSSEYRTNYMNALKRHVSFLLLSGMIENRMPGSLRLIVRGHGYQFFEHRMNQLLEDLSNYDADALCFNMKALKALLPYMQEHQPLKLSIISYKFITSRFWRFMWLEVGVSLKTTPNAKKSTFFYSFLELASVICYGTRSSSLLKRLYTSCLKSLWDPIIGVLSWNLDPKVLCRMVTFIADLLLMSFQDDCMQHLTQEFIAVMVQCIAKVHAQGTQYLELYSTQTADERNDFYHHYASIAVRMLEALTTFLSQGLDEIQLLYDLSSIGTAKMTLWQNERGTQTQQVKFDYVDTKVFPRVLPCFNGNCMTFFHVDMPHLHVNSVPTDFQYCKKCGIPSYCSASCAESHWEGGHKEVCGFFRTLPTFARFNPPVMDPDDVIINTFEDNPSLQPILDKEGNVITVF